MLLVDCEDQDNREKWKRVCVNISLKIRQVHRQPHERHFLVQTNHKVERIMNGHETTWSKGRENSSKKMQDCILFGDDKLWVRLRKFVSDKAPIAKEDSLIVKNWIWFTKGFLEERKGKTTLTVKLIFEWSDQCEPGLLSLLFSMLWASDSASQFQSY